MESKSYIDKLLETADEKSYCDFCRILLVIWWNM